MPVNNIETIPERPSPSASMYLKEYGFKLINGIASLGTRKLFIRHAGDTYEKYGNRTKRQHSRFWRLNIRKRQMRRIGIHHKPCKKLY